MERIVETISGLFWMVAWNLFLIAYVWSAIFFAAHMIQWLLHDLAVNGI